MEEVSVDHMADHNLQPEASFYNWPYRVDVAKVGGGTVGHECSGKWVLNLHNRLQESLESFVFDSPNYYNHLSVAVTVCGDYLA